MANSKKVTVAAVFGIGSFFVYSLYKKCCKDDEDPLNDDHNTKGSTFSPLNILDFWFGKIRKNYAIIDKSKFNHWFELDHKFDAEIEFRFGAFMKHVLEEREYDDWKHTAKGTLALIIIASQFPRHVYRNTAKMFEYDTFALELCEYAIEKKFDVQLLRMHPAFAQFVYRPLMHSEQLKHHQLSVEKSNYILSALSKTHPYYEWCVSDQCVIKQHMDVIETCGRYPQRNRLLERDTTRKEKEVMKKYNINFA
eukprot:155793_1